MPKSFYTNEPVQGDDPIDGAAHPTSTMSTPTLDPLSALKQIAGLWPADTTVKITDVHGVNDGRSRAIYLEAAIDIARKAISAAELVAAHTPPAPVGMTRDEALELLEAHFGPDAYINLAEHFKRHRHIGEWESSWYIYSNKPEPQSWERETLSECVAAAMSAVVPVLASEPKGDVA